MTTLETKRLRAVGSSLISRNSSLIDMNGLRIDLANRLTSGVGCAGFWAITGLSLSAYIGHRGNTVVRSALIQFVFHEDFVDYKDEEQSDKADHDKSY